MLLCLSSAFAIGNRDLANIRAGLDWAASFQVLQLEMMTTPCFSDVQPESWGGAMTASFNASGMCPVSFDPSVTFLKGGVERGEEELR